MRLLCVLLTALLGQQATAATFDCFTVIDPRGEVVYKSNRSPIDLSKPISQAMAAAYPGHYLIWSHTEDACTDVDRLRRGSAAQTNGSATLERSKLTAEADDIGKRTAGVTKPGGTQRGTGRAR